MGTEILLPQDWLIEGTRVSTASFNLRKRSYGNVSNNFNKSFRFNHKPAGRSERPDLRKRVISSMKRSSSDDGLMRNCLVAEKVAILRRGQSLDSIIGIKKSNKEGLDSEAVRKQIRIVGGNSPLSLKCDMYAGSAFYISPAPSSLPLPSFYKKKEVSVTAEDSATKDLRRLLRLEL